MTTLRTYLSQSLYYPSPLLEEPDTTICIPDDYYRMEDETLYLSYSKQKNQELPKLHSPNDSSSSVIIASTFFQAISLLKSCKSIFSVNPNLLSLDRSKTLSEQSVRKLFSTICRFFRWIHTNLSTDISTLKQQYQFFCQPLGKTIQEKYGYQNILSQWKFQENVCSSGNKTFQVSGYYFHELLESRYEDIYFPVIINIDKISFHSNQLFGNYLIVRTSCPQNEFNSRYILPLSTMNQSKLSWISFTNRKNISFHPETDPLLDAYQNASLLEDWSIEGHWSSTDTRYYGKGTEYNMITWNPWTSSKAPKIETSNIVSLIFGDPPGIFEKPYLLLQTITGRFYKLQYCDQYYNTESIRIA